MATILPNGVTQFIDANGNPLAGGTVAFFIPGTTITKDTYQDPAGDILNTNPVTLNASGEAIIYGSGSYRQIVKDSAGNLIWDQLTADTAVGGLAWGGTSTGTPNAQIISASSFSQQDGQQISFIVGAALTNTAGATVAPGGGSGIAILKDTMTGPTALTGGELVGGNEVQLSYDAVRGAFHIMNAPIIFGSTAGTVTQGNDPRLAPTGVIWDYAGSAAPTGWVLCFGQAVSRTSFAALFAVLGTAYGTGDGSTTFNVPDLRGRIGAGQDDMGGTSANRLTNSATGGVDGSALGNSGGEQAHQITIAELAAHTHTLGVSSGIQVNGGTGPATAVPTGTTTSSSTGSNTAHNNVQPTLIVNKIIKT